MDEAIKRKGFKILEWSFKKDYVPTEKRIPVYNFLRRTMDKQDAEKQKAKDFTSDYIFNFFVSIKEKKVKLLTLPGLTWDFERRLKRRFGLNRRHRIRVAVTGCENDYKVFCLAAAKIPGRIDDKLQPYFSDNLGHYVVTNQHHQTYLLNADIFDVIKKTNDKGIKYNCVWFDTTNTVISVVNKLTNFNHALHDDCILIFTLFKGREHIKFETNRTDYLSNHLSPYGFKLSHQLEYFDTCPMIHLIYTRTKKPTP